MKIKRIVLFSTLIFCGTLFSFSQRGTFDAHFQQMSDSFDAFVAEKEAEFSAFSAKQNEEFSAFVERQWQLFEDFRLQSLALSSPKLTKAPVAPNTQEPEVFINFSETQQPITHATATAGSYAVQTSLSQKGAVQKCVAPSASKRGVVQGSQVLLDFYGARVVLPFSPKLKIASHGAKEQDAALYFRNISKLTAETEALWQAIEKQSVAFGLNEWGRFCLLRMVAEAALTNVNDRVLFCFYMLRNEGGYKVKLARGQSSGKLTLLLSLDNKKEVYSYIYFTFKENNRPVKYYTVYGGGTAKESIYSYDFCEQESALRQMRLDFDRTLNIGKCNRHRTLKVKKLNSEIQIPYNTAHLSFLNDVPMTIFPIYFSSPLSIEAQRALAAKFGTLRQKYNQTEIVAILLNFVQTAFAYKTDDDQFGYEKYFYPEEVLGYSYSDCEDRSALFAWLVKTYAGADVIGLQYEGHVAAAVCLGDNVTLKGDVFPFAGKKYYVCDPTYINASIGMTMPQFKGKTPKVINLRKK